MIFEKMRMHLGVVYDTASAPHGSGFLSDLVTCPWCLSVWIAGLFLAAFVVAPLFTLPVAILLALSAVTGILVGWGATPHG